MKDIDARDRWREAALRLWPRCVVDRPLLVCNGLATFSERDSGGTTVYLCDAHASRGDLSRDRVELPDADLVREQSR